MRKNIRRKISVLLLVLVMAGGSGIENNVLAQEAGMAAKEAAFFKS